MPMGADLLAIIKDESERQTALRAEPLIDCPECGTLLQVRADGLKDCPLGHFTTRRTVKGAEYA